MSVLNLVKAADAANPTSNHVVMFADTNTKLLCQKNDGNAVQNATELFILMTSDFTYTDDGTNTLANVTGMTWTIGNANEKWIFDAEWFITTSAIEAISLGYTGPSNGTILSTIQGQTSTTAYKTVPLNAWNTNSATISANSSTLGSILFRIHGYMLVSPSDPSSTFQMQINANSSATRITRVKAGSWLKAHRVQ